MWLFLRLFLLYRAKVSPGTLLSYHSLAVDLAGVMMVVERRCIEAEPVKPENIILISRAFEQQRLRNARRRTARGVFSPVQ